MQSRTGLIARNAGLLEAWRPLYQCLDIFYGLEGTSDAALQDVSRDATTQESLEPAQVARSLDYGVTGNFIVDPASEEHDFGEFWDLVMHHGLQRAGFIIFTSIPGIEFFGQLAPILNGQP